MEKKEKTLLPWMIFQWNEKYIIAGRKLGVEYDRDIEYAQILYNV